MSKFPYMNFPFPFYRGYSRIPPSPYSFSNAHVGNNPPVYGSGNVPNTHINKIDSKFDNCMNEDSSKDTRNANFSEKNKSNKNNDDYLFDLFGLKIYSDDVLLVSLIYFLYSEGVKDDSLFLVLILLLLS